MKKGDKIIFPQVTAQHLEDIGLVTDQSHNKTLALCGKEVTIKSFDGSTTWRGKLGEYAGIFEIEESIFGFPANWIK